MIKSFSEFVNESMEKNVEFLKKLAMDIIAKLRESSKEESSNYATFSGMEFTEPFMFDLILKVRRETDPDLNDDPHFRSLSWEKLNYDDLGYSIDANTRMSKLKTMIPKITVHMILNPKKEPLLYEKLYTRLLDILVHETNHLDQLGINRDPFNVNVSSKEKRAKSKKSHKYFLLPDEIESMIEGMYVRSKEQRIPLDKVFLEYLNPFRETKYITEPEFQKVMFTWITRAIELYPDAEFSPASKKIIASI
jgi:hypothetical protein